MKELLIFLIFVLVSSLEGSKWPRRRSLIHPKTFDDIPPNVEVKWYKGMRVDHFAYGNTDTFNLRFMWNNTFYKAGGPIFFYTGNEGSLEGFVTATGIMFDIAQQFNASLIFAEHRYYGQTQPYNTSSYANLKNLGYLTSEQALADYAELLSTLKTPNNQFNYTFPSDTKVISFGGSYGGMLSAWFRMKYPHIVTGAWAGSAPLIYMRGGGIEPGVFDNITSRTYVDNGCNRFILANVWNAVLNLSATADGRAFLNNNTVFTLDPRTPIRNATDGWNLNAFMREAIEYMAMVDYPYPTSFLEPLPAWPVKVACSFMNSTGTTFTDQQLVTMVAQAANVYYNYNQVANYTWCIDYSVCGDEGVGGLGNDALGWPWQECSEIVMAMCAHGGTNDVFWEECGTDIYQLLQEQCVQIFANLSWTSANWDIDAVKKLYGFDLSAASNLILTQGHLDPWSGGGYSASATNPSRGIYILEIPGSAHHLDLRQPNTCDPNTITNARFQIINIISCWLTSSCQNTMSLYSLPDIQIPTGIECKDVVQGFPWGQSYPTTSAGSMSLMLAFVVALFWNF
ncbi:unnamed protein product [Caenorhabditis angaria]|uniref:Uncharacterized protein n=1 Tax=Caenorhabditis angaria TaxID=860376 RepID=A0A9P1IHF9_9PELO|nr:unnamed protein product [Caenorhabditis angaria]